MIDEKTFIKSMELILKQASSENKWYDDVEKTFGCTDKVIEHSASIHMIEMLEGIMGDNADLIRRYIYDSEWGVNPFEYKQDSITVVVNNLANLYMAIRLSNKESNNESKV